MWNKCKAILIASSNQKASLYQIGNSNFIGYSQEDDRYTGRELYIISEDEIKEGDWTLMFDDFGNLFISNEPKQYLGIKAGHHLNKGLRKVIATTDKSLIINNYSDVNRLEDLEYSLPQISQQFIEQYITEYNKGNIIIDVLVEYEELLGDKGIIAVAFKESDFKLKINPYNTINIKTVKDSFSRDEVIGFVKQAIIDCKRDELDYHVNGDYQNLNKYIEQNL
jgi:hypothetical protein